MYHVIVMYHVIMLRTMSPACDLILCMPTLSSKRVVLINKNLTPAALGTNLLTNEQHMQCTGPLSHHHELHIASSVRVINTDLA